VEWTADTSAHSSEGAKGERRRCTGPHTTQPHHATTIDRANNKSWQASTLDLDAVVDKSLVQDLSNRRTDEYALRSVPDLRHVSERLRQASMVRDNELQDVPVCTPLVNARHAAQWVWFSLTG
jgi:hypothetical protein